MKLENQVVNLELSKKLKELGIKQESYFVWVKVKHDGNFFPTAKGTLAYWHAERLGFDNIYSAFTIAELGEMLPKGYYSLLTKEDGWVCFPKTKGAYAPGVLVQATWAEAEANARAKMLIYLIENGLLNKQWTRNK